MPTQYQVNLNMSGDTVTALLENGYSLYGFQAVAASGGGSPVVWFQTNDYALTTSIIWDVNYQAYTSLSQIIPQGVITAEASYPANLGQVLNVTNQMGIGEMSDGSPSLTMSQGVTILNQTSTQFTCGLQQQQPDGSYSPICAFPLFGNNMDVIVPIEQVFFMFSALPITTAAVVEQSFGPGVLINLTESNTQTVSYDINAGWSWANNGSWAQSYAPNLNLSNLLIQQLSSLPA